MYTKALCHRLSVTLNTSWVHGFKFDGKLFSCHGSLWTNNNNNNNNNINCKGNCRNVYSMKSGGQHQHSIILRWFKASHVMGLHVIMVSIQMCQVSKVHNCLEMWQIIEFTFAMISPFPFPFFSPQQREEIKKYIASKNLFSLLILWNISFITSRVHLARQSITLSVKDTYREMLWIQEIKQSTMGCDSG